MRGILLIRIEEQGQIASEENELGGIIDDIIGIAEEEIINNESSRVARSELGNELGDYLLKIEIRKGRRGRRRNRGG